jgi:HEAT repeat protein
MRRPTTRLAILGLFLALASGPLTAAAVDDKEPSYNGKPLASWVALLKDKDFYVRRGAAEALKTMGKEAKAAVPALTNALEDNFYGVRQTAAQALGSIGPDAEAAIPALSNAAAKDHYACVRLAAAEALGKIGPATKDVVPTLSNALRDLDDDVRRAAAEALGKCGLEAKDAVLALREAEKDSSEPVRRTAAEGLKYFRVAQLVRAAKDKDAGARLKAIAELGDLGPEAKAAVPALAEALRDDDIGVRRAAAVALGRVGPEAREAARDLRDAMKSEDVHVRCAGATALAKVNRSDANEAVSVLLDALQSPDGGARREVVEALGVVGPGTKEAFPALVKTLADPDDALRREAATAMERFREADLSVDVVGVAIIPELREKSKNGDGSVRKAAGHALGRYARAAVTEWLGRDKGDRHSKAAEAVAKLERDAVPALAEAIRMRVNREVIEMPGSHAVPDALEALLKLGPEARGAVPALMEALMVPPKPKENQGGGSWFPDIYGDPNRVAVGPPLVDLVPSAS